MCVPKALKALSRRLSTFPLWSLLLGVLAGIFLADSFTQYFATTYWFVIACIATAITLLARKQAITFIVLGGILGNGIHGLNINHQRTWVQAADEGKLAGQCTLTATVIDTGPRQDGPYLLKTSQLSLSTKNPATPLPRAKGIRVMLKQ